MTSQTPYVNTISAERQPPYPGNRELERRIKSIIRWNAMAMVVKANRLTEGIGGHISSYASCATLYEVGFNHFFRGPDHPCGGDLVFFQGHASPGIYSRAYVEGRLPATTLHNFRRDLSESGGATSYPHPWLMPQFWQFPTVSMGLGPLMAIYQARYIRYLDDRGLRPYHGQKVWAFLGDGETDEPESLGAINLASRERLDNLIFVVNCNLQRLDGPVRGNGSIVQELEAVFRGAGWNVIKVLWGSDWDELLARDEDGRSGSSHGRSGRRRVSEIRGRRWSLYSPSLLGSRSEAGDHGASHVGRPVVANEPGRTRSGQGLRGLQGGVRERRPTDRDSGAHDQGLRVGRSGRRQEHHASAEEAQRRRDAAFPRSIPHSVHR